MGRIHTLDPITANSIAAGEVVERPASVVKELCENAIDAEASVISVHCSGGGLKRIQVADNGSGMDPDDAEMAFRRHATSKLRSIKDLERLRSMGFRGEALAAISAVSKLTLITRQKGAEQGTRVYIEGGEIQEILRTDCAEGSLFLVEELFFNTPARRKFMKSDRTEAAHIQEIICYLALARPDISFRLRLDNGSDFRSPGNGEIRSTVYALFGRELADLSIFVPERHSGELAGLELDAVLGRPELAKRNRKGQYFLVNGRAIRSPLLAKALDEAYRPFLMKGQYPWAVLRLTVAPKLLDINTHPQKMEVRFWNEQALFRWVYHAVSVSLQDACQMLVPNRPGNSATIFPARGGAESAKAADCVGAAKVPAQESKAEEEAPPVYVAPPLLAKERDALYRWNRSHEDADAEGRAEGTDRTKMAESVENEMSQDVRQARESAAALEASPHAGIFQRILSAKLTCILFDTYILLESREEEAISYFCLDQHAAHERILYEELLEVYRGQGRYQQQILDPVFVDFTALEYAQCEARRDFLERLGYAYDPAAGSSVILRAVPAGMEGESAVRSFRETVEELASDEAGTAPGAREGENDSRDLLRFATRACKAAVKAHDRLNPEDVRQLVLRLSRCSQPFQCPHGRPSIVEIRSGDMEKLFKRLV